MYIHVELNTRILIECKCETRLRQEQVVVWKTCTLQRPDMYMPIRRMSRLSVFNGIYPYLLGPSSSVGIATDYGLDDAGIESRWGRDFPPVQTGSGAYPASCKMGSESFPGVKCGRGVLLTTHPLLVPRSWKSRAIPLPTLWSKPGL